MLVGVTVFPLIVVLIATHVVNSIGPSVSRVRGVSLSRASSMANAKIARALGLAGEVFIAGGLGAALSAIWDGLPILVPALFIFIGGLELFILRKYFERGNTLEE